MLSLTTVITLYFMYYIHLRLSLAINDYLLTYLLTYLLETRNVHATGYTMYLNPPPRSAKTLWPDRNRRSGAGGRQTILAVNRNGGRLRLNATHPDDDDDDNESMKATVNVMVKGWTTAASPHYL